MNCPQPLNIFYFLVRFLLHVLKDVLLYGTLWMCADSGGTLVIPSCTFPINCDFLGIKPAISTLPSHY